MEPPRRTLSLGLRLGVLITSTVVGTMALLTGAQLAVELQVESRDHEKQLALSLAPLVAELQSAGTKGAARAAVGRYHAAYVAQGRKYHDLAVINAAGGVVLGKIDYASGRRQTLLHAAVPVVSPVLGPEPLAVFVTEDGTAFYAARTQRWRDWAIHVGAAALSILALLFVVIRREVTGPIERLLGGVRKMELGYWDDMPDPGGAWEVRWLGWRFRTLGQELSRTVEHLVAAQRRAYAVDREAHMDSEATAAEPPPAPVSSIHPDPAEIVPLLQARLERLRHADPGDSAARALAQIAWDHSTIQAARFGQPELGLSLEDAALRVLDPDGFIEISGRIEAERTRLEAAALARKAQIRRALAARGVPIVEIFHRIKHPAGIWKKMRQKNLAFEQIHDLVALRIVVPTETDCYHALGVVQDLHAPIVGRFKDYIAQPKPNGYRGLHACVRDPEGAVFEVQIRSIAMHRHAEQGPAAHADYKHATRVPASRGRVALWKRLLELSGGMLSVTLKFLSAARARRTPTADEDDVPRDAQSCRSNLPNKNNR